MRRITVLLGSVRSRAIFEARMQAVILRLRAVSCCGLTTRSPRGRGAARHPHDHVYGEGYYSIDGYPLRTECVRRSATGSNRPAS
jgi:hypothetical protein